MSGPQWFRLYSRIVDDEKLRLLAFEDRWHFVALCCLKNSGLLDEPDSQLRQRKIAVKMGVQSRELEEIFRRLQEVELIDENMIPIAWDRLQFVSDSSTDRSRKFRKNKKMEECNGEEADMQRCIDVAATPPEADTEAEADTDTEAEVIVVRARKHLVPEDFWPKPSRGSKTAQRMAGWSPDFLEEQVEKFIAHHRMKENKYTDWQRAWTTWALNSFDGKDRNGRTGKRSAWLG